MEYLVISSKNIDASIFHFTTLQYAKLNSQETYFHNKNIMIVFLGMLFHSNLVQSLQTSHKPYIFRRRRKMSRYYQPHTFSVRTDKNPRISSTANITQLIDTHKYIDCHNSFAISWWEVTMVRHKIIIIIRHCKNPCRPTKFIQFVFESMKKIPYSLRQKKRESNRNAKCHRNSKISVVTGTWW